MWMLYGCDGETKRSSITCVCARVRAYLALLQRLRLRCHIPTLQGVRSADDRIVPLVLRVRKGAQVEGRVEVEGGVHASLLRQAEAAVLRSITRSGRIQSVGQPIASSSVIIK